ncbi:hypothetical protein FPOA_03372 [Fusarium poae]|uniref:Uncharacterized protein n=1 Tax=Fusarium poae TaxID=36050 RepID=A0A1B8B9N6_FUSPO|nr:hypothetical protein FPOA_03372 [Fusarium poae]
MTSSENPTKFILSTPEGRTNAFNKILVASGPVFVFQESATRPIEFFVPGKPTQWPELPLAKLREFNEQEVDVVFYGSNHFHFVDTAMQRETLILQSFLASLTSTCTNLLSHMSLSFPALEAPKGQPETIQLQQNAMSSLELLRDNCSNIKILEFYIHKGNAFGLVEEAPVNSQSLQDALSQVDAQLRAFSSLKTIIIRYFHDTLAPEIMQLMHGLGWIVLKGN